MVLRTARKGPKRGSSFWGCSTWSQTKCNGILPFDDEVSDSQPSDPETSAPETLSTRSGQVAVAWSDRVGRQAWISEYCAISSLPGFARSLADDANQTLKNALGQTLLLFDRNRERTVEDDLRRVGGLLT